MCPPREDSMKQTQTTAVPPVDNISQGAEKIDDFFTLRYHSLSRWCHQRWNGSDGDVMHSAYELAAKRYTHINFGLFCVLAREAARNLGVHRWTQDEEKTIILPPTPRAAERIEAHLATAIADDPPEFPSDGIYMARKLVRQEKKGQLNFWGGGAR
jgi:hypothetical protein